MLVDIVVNWRMKLFVSILFMTALQSCFLEQTNLYAAWCLEQHKIQGTSRQIVKIKVRLPNWYLRLHYILSQLKNLSKIDNDTIISMLSLAFLAIGAFCLSLGSLLGSQQVNKRNTNSAPNWHCLVLLKGRSKIITVGVAISDLPNVCEPVDKSTNEITLEISNLCVLSENKIVTLNETWSITKEQATLRQEFIQEAKSCDEKRDTKAWHNQKTIDYPAATQKQIKKFYRSLSEKDKRRYAGIEALKLGRGGIVYIADLLECDRKTVRKGIEELKRMSKRNVDPKRIRRKGGGRKPYYVKHESIDQQFLDVLQDNTAGDPMREEVIWTNLKPNEICRYLTRDHNQCVSTTVIYQLLEKYDYRQRKLIKNQTMKEVAHRNAQFENIAYWRSSYQGSPNPLISIDSKKKEYLGNFYRDGRLYTKEAQCCYDHDFTSFADGVIIPHGIYDVKKNQGYLHLGTSHDTSEFACDCIKNWWLKYGRYEYPDADSILILCDGGGSNSSRHYIFKQDLQNLVNEIGIEIRISHFPPYCSKWNPIEHKLFPHVTRACQGVVFENIELVKELMQNTKTRKGLEVEVEIIDRFYEVGREANDDFKQNMGILFDDVLPNWNYKAIPNGEVI